jgi:hypothetical protein
MERDLTSSRASQGVGSSQAPHPLAFYRADWPSANYGQEVNDETRKDNRSHFCYTAPAPVQLLVLRDRLARRLLLHLLRGQGGRPGGRPVYPVLFEALRCHHRHRYPVFDSLPAALVNGKGLVPSGWGAQTGFTCGTARGGGGAGKSARVVRGNRAATAGCGVGLTNSALMSLTESRRRLPHRRPRCKRSTSRPGG